jgi:uncharacterized membrane-anchored protein YhcB (DUF1043 family)
VPADSFTPPPGWEGVAATLDELRANYAALADFLDRQWRELEAWRDELGEQAHRLDHRQREIDRHEEDVAARLELAEVYKRLAEAHCDLWRHQSSDADDTEKTLTAAWARIEEVETEIVELKKTKPTPRPRGELKLPGR